jgi:signal transduction histidine kinase
MSTGPLNVSLKALIDIVLLQTQGSAKAIFYLVEPEIELVRHILEVSEEENTQYIKDFPVETHSLAYELLINKGEPLITTEVEEDSAWDYFKPLACEYNCRACWSFLLRTEENVILGTLIIYLTKPRTPTTKEFEMADALTRAAAVIFSYEKKSLALSHNEKAMKTNELRLLEQLRVRDEFIANASHELNSPLASMGLYIKIIEQSFQKNNNPFQKEMITKLKKQLELLEVLIQNMLDNTCLEKGKLQLKIVRFNLNELILEKMQEMQSRTKNHQFEAKLSSPDEIDADRVFIGQVITNLLSNAIKYSPRGGKIVITSEVNNASIKVTILDNGLGIPKDDLENIFYRFYRVKNNNVSGMGIGLSICKEIINLHKGTITVTSQEGMGSNFSFTIPKNHQWKVVDSII